MRLSAAQERFQKNAVIVAARQTIYAAAILKYGKRITVGDVAKIVTKGTTPKTYGFDFVQEGIPFLRAEEVLDGQILYEGIPFHIDAETNNFMNRSRTQSGDVLVTIAGSIGRAAVVPRSAPELNMNQAVALIRCKDEINPYFLCHILQSSEAQKQIFSSTVTTAISNLSLGKIKEIIIPLPPLADQEAIAEFLEAVQKHHTYEGLSKNLPDYMQQVLRIVPRIEELATRIEEARGLRRKAVEEAKALFTSTINKAWSDQSTWNIRYVKDLVTIVSGQVDPTIDPYASLPHINGEAIESGTCRLLPYQTAKNDGVTSGKYHFRPNSILYSKIRPYLRKAVQVPVEGICSADVYAFESINPVLDPRFFMYSLIAPNFTSYANTLSGRTRMPKLNQDQLLSFHMGYPPLSEQRRIVNHLDQLQMRISVLKQLQSETSAELDALLPSILDKAFKGEL